MSRSPRTVLDEDKRTKVLALVANGSSRRVAAKFVGCAPSTITRTALRDPEFAAKLSSAEQAPEVDALRALRAAARKDRYWRAAAWILERKNPDDFAIRPPKLFSADQVIMVMTQLFESLTDENDRDRYKRAMAKTDQILQDLYDEHYVAEPRTPLELPDDDPPPTQDPAPCDGAGDAFKDDDDDAFPDDDNRDPFQDHDNHYATPMQHPATELQQLAATDDDITSEAPEPSL